MQAKIAVLLLLGLLSYAAFAQQPTSTPYRVVDLPLPQGLDAETGGIAFLPDGRLAACFTRGEIMIYDFVTSQWDVFAQGLHEPLGLLVESNSQMVVLQRPELTRVRDTDGDGKADSYETITDDFGLSGNYHEFNYGPVKDKDGNFYIALNTASSGAGFRDNARGPVNLMGRDSTTGLRQMYSVVPYRGWVLKITPDGQVIPWASGLRSPNGIGITPDGTIFVADNQSDWVETSKLYHIQEGRFYGHPASLVWEKGWDGRHPFRVPIEELDAKRTEAIVYFPHGIMANSPSDPVVVPENSQFPQFAGQMLIGEMNHSRIIRVMLEKVNGELQGACVPFLDGNGLRMGNNRLAFAPDGSLLTGQITHGWAGSKGIQHIKNDRESALEIQSMTLTSDGFQLTFTQPLDKTTATKLTSYLVRHYYYPYQKKPIKEPIDHSNQADIQTITPRSIHLSKDKRKVRIQLPDLKKGYVYEFKLQGIQSQSGELLQNALVCYTLNNLLPTKAR
jgi:glucose/arabinose dehydrogenase